MAEEILSPQSGYIGKIDCDEVGVCSLILGGGRETKESAIDLSVGLVLHKKTGDPVSAGEPLATIYANDREKLSAAKERFLKAYHISEEQPPKRELIRGIIK